jgi:heptosyltransferase III
LTANILILHPGALGDIILSLPALLMLRRRFPEAEILLAGDVDKIIVADSAYADKTLSLSSLPLHRLYSHDSLTNLDSAFWNSFDRIVSWTGHGNPEITQRLEELRVETICAPWKPECGDARHVSQIFADSLHPWLPRLSVLPDAKINLGERNRGIAGEWLAFKGWKGEALTALHPGAGSLTKRWALGNFRSLALQICGANSSILIIEGPAESGLGAELSTALPPNRVYLTKSAPLPLLAGLLTYCRAFTGNDSGLAHLAAGLGIPTIVVFGPTMPQHWAPCGNSVVVHWRNENCLACQGNAEEMHTCLHNISAADVWRDLKNYL